MKKIKRIIAVLLCLALVAGFAGCDVSNITANIKGDGNPLKIKVEKGEAVVYESSDKSTVSEIVIPDEYEGAPVTKVDDFGVVNLENVEKIVIGKNVKEIGVWAFTNNPKLKVFEVNPENEYFCAKDGVLYTKDMKTLLFCPISQNLQKRTETDKDGKKQEVEYNELVIPEGVETIRSKAFYKNTHLEKVTFPESLKRIEEKAFMRCGAIKELKLPEKLEFIGKDAFAYCTGAGAVVIPASVKQIDEYAFYNCTSMLDVKVNNAEANITLGEKWYPTDNGRNLDKLKISWAK